METASFPVFSDNKKSRKRFLFFGWSAGMKLGGEVWRGGEEVKPCRKPDNRAKRTEFPLGWRI